MTPIKVQGLEKLTPKDLTKFALDLNIPTSARYKAAQTINALTDTEMHTLRMTIQTAVRSARIVEIAQQSTDNTTQKPPEFFEDIKNPELDHAISLVPRTSEIDTEAKQIAFYHPDFAYFLARALDKVKTSSTPICIYHTKNGNLSIKLRTITTSQTLLCTVYTDGKVVYN